MARWRMGDGAVLSVAANLGADPVSLQPLRGAIVFESAWRAGACVLSGRLAGRSTVALMEAPP
jgi:hypothetical protein